MRDESRSALPYTTLKVQRQRTSPVPSSWRSIRQRNAYKKMNIVEGYDVNSFCPLVKPRAKLLEQPVRTGPPALSQDLSSAAVAKISNVSHYTVVRQRMGATFLITGKTSFSTIREQWNTNHDIPDLGQTGAHKNAFSRFPPPIRVQIAIGNCHLSRCNSANG